MENGEERSGEGSRDPSSAASEAESSGKEGRGGSRAPSLPMARGANKEVNVNSNVENDLRDEIFVEKLKEYADTLQQSEGQVMNENADLSSASGLIAKVSQVPTGTKGVRFDTRARVMHESRINPNSSGEIVIKLPDKLEGDVILVPAEFENDVVEITNLGLEDMEKRMMQVTVKNKTNHELTLPINSVIGNLIISDEAPKDQLSPWKTVLFKPNLKRIYLNTFEI